MNPTSLVLLTVDCLRADRVGFGGYARPLTPFLDSVATEAVTFSNAMVAGAPTYFSLPAIMASRYALGLGRDVIGIAPSEPTIASVLQNQGYETAAFVGANPYLSPRFGYDQGFDHFSDFLHSDPSNQTETSVSPGQRATSTLNRRVERLSRITKLSQQAYNELYFRYCQWRSASSESTMDQLRRYPSAEVLVNAACAWLRNLSDQDQPFFLWIHFMDPHHPYYPPLEALQSLGISGMNARRARFLNSFWNRGDLSPTRLQRHRSEVQALYDAGILWADHQMARLAGCLKDLKRWHETLFVATADHGEEFLEHGGRHHSADALREELIHVPLILRAPDVLPCKLPGVFSLIDLAPTLLEALAVHSPSSFRGRSKWKEISAGNLPDTPAISECIAGCDNPISTADRDSPRLLATRQGQYKLVFDCRTGRDEFYNLSVDPSEMRPLPLETDRNKRLELLRVAHEHLRASRGHRDSELALRARLREIRQRVELMPAHAASGCAQVVLQVREHG